MLNDSCLMPSEVHLCHPYIHFLSFELFPLEHLGVPNLYSMKSNLYSVKSNLDFTEYKLSFIKCSRFL